MDKLETLKKIIGEYDSIVVAFSGGVDSTFLAWACKTVLGKPNVLLVTAKSSTYPEVELEFAKKSAEFLGLQHQIIISEELEIPGFSDNPPDRCYYCKKELFSKIASIAKHAGLGAVFDGSNKDDLDDYRPGRKAIAELKVRSPLVDAGMTKADIRRYSQEAGLPTAQKPSFACLASRFPYGENITNEKLLRVGKAEQKLRDCGFTQFRVRSHGDLARIEFVEAEMEKSLSLRKEIAASFKDDGYTYVAIDANGYRTGAMNEQLAKINQNGAST